MVNDQFRLRIVACGNEVVVPTPLLVEGTELDEAVAHDVGIGRQSRTNLIHGVFSDLVPILPVAVNDLQLATILMADSRCHLQVFFRRAVPLFLLFRSYLDVETVGLKALTHQFIEHHAGVHTP